MSEWLLLRDHPAPENVVLETKIDDTEGRRNEQRLMLAGNLWWTPDRSVYVYYRPTHWRRAAPTTSGAYPAGRAALEKENTT